MSDHASQPARLYNTLTKRVEALTPADPSRVTFYTCGPTVYDDAHIGNFRSFLAADLLRRWLESPLCTLSDDAGAAHAGPRVVEHVMNITDVGHMTDDNTADGSGEDKMAVAGRRIAEAKKSGKLPKDADVDPNDPRAIAAFYTGRFLDDAKKLGMKVAIEGESDPSLLPRATDNIDGMKRMIEGLASKGFAYAAGDAVYFDVQKYEQYGQLSGNTLDKLRGGAGGRVSDADQASKHHPADFLLWKSDPKHLMRWPGPVIGGAPVGEGYPGWHIECSVMSLDRLDPDRERSEIDLHSGGEDNIFPHHECERAQSCAATGHARFARHWFHPRFLMVEGAKMSKSKGTFFTARELFEQGHEPAAVRLELIKTHYRSNADFSMQGLKDSARQVERWRRARYEIARRAKGWDDPAVAAVAYRLINTRVATCLADDLNISGAIGAVNSTIDELLKKDYDDTKAWRLDDEQIDEQWRGDEHFSRDLPDLFRDVEKIFGVLDLERAALTATDIGVYQGVDPSPEVEAKLAARAAARKSKDFAAADAIRDELAAMGLAIKDVAGGKVEVSRG